MACSSGVATVRATTSAEAPGYAVVIWTVGGTMVGYWATGRNAAAANPNLWQRFQRGFEARFEALREGYQSVLGAILQHRHRRLTKFGGKRAALPESDLHRLRLLAKKQRYVADFFRELHPRRATAKCARR